MNRIVIAGVALLVSASPALAQSDSLESVGPRTGDREVTLSGSGLSDDSFDNTTLGVSGSYGVYVSRNTLIGIRQSVNYVGVDDADDSINASTRGFADYVFGADRLRPFVGANVGFIYGDNVNDSFAFGPELGLKYYADANTFVFGMMEYQILVDDSSDVDDAIDDGVFNYTIGIGFNF